MKSVINKVAQTEIRANPPTGRVAVKLAQQLANTNALPDWAGVSIHIVMAVTERSRASVYRDVASGRLPKPFKQGSSTRWRLGDLRRALEHAGPI